MKIIFGAIDRINERNQTFIKVLAKVQNNHLCRLEDSIEEFPNTGKVFYYKVPSDAYKGKLGFYTVVESNSYDINIPISSKYVVSQEASNIGYVEIVKVDYSVEMHELELVSLIKNGIVKTHEFTSKIVLLTAEGYLIGPYSPKLNKENQWIAELNDNGLLDVRKNNVDIIEYYDVNFGVERYFISTAFINTKVDRYLDCSNNDRIVRDALKILKDEKETREITRKITKVLVDLVSEIPEEVRKGRISRAVNLLQNHLISPEEMELFEKELLQYGPVIKKINEAIDKDLLVARKKLESDHKKVINETKKLKLEKGNLKIELKNMTDKKNRIDDDIKKAEEALQLKLREMQQNVYQTMLNLLPLPMTLSTGNEAESSVTNVRSSQWFVREQEKENMVDGIEVLIRNIIKNLERIHVEKERAELIALTTIGAILFRNPIIIEGENSFDIAQILGWTIAGNDHITIFPDIKEYSNEVLTSYFTQYNRIDKIKSLHLSNIESSSAELYIPSFIDYWSVSTNCRYPELLIVSMKDITEVSNDFIGKLKYAPVINTDSIGIKGELRKARLLGEIKFGFISIEDFVENELLVGKSKAFREFKDVVEEIGMQPKMIVHTFKQWFCLFEKVEYDEEMIINWVLQVFLQKHIDIEQYNFIAEELDVEVSVSLP
ncbi:hypothetical protein ACTFPQ_24985 [Bacillus cereus group sp. MYBK5-1]|uniref:hypothetical protein n=1 Tax=Bacillus cereus group sp. MYBK5-1 TaxID=3450623 RepID=UPI003F78B355